jgi:hypothetical protein
MSANEDINIGFDAEEKAEILASKDRYRIAIRSAIKPPNKQMAVLLGSQTCKLFYTGLIIFDFHKNFRINIALLVAVQMLAVCLLSTVFSVEMFQWVKMQE